MMFRRPCPSPRRGSGGRLHDRPPGSVGPCSSAVSTSRRIMSRRPWWPISWPMGPALALTPGAHSNSWAACARSCCSRFFRAGSRPARGSSAPSDDFHGMPMRPLSWRASTWPRLWSRSATAGCVLRGPISKTWFSGASTSLPRLLTRACVKGLSSRGLRYSLLLVGVLASELSFDHMSRVSAPAELPLGAVRRARGTAGTGGLLHSTSRSRRGPRGCWRAWADEAGVGPRDMAAAPTGGAPPLPLRPAATQ
mmetsp:Transcript_70996/g.200420  ORF Transcript_70996/g.200420 Transcript_70996/m.200420 type:complete len:252 (-) Transcript_70996:39-794(-)